VIRLFIIHLLLIDLERDAAFGGEDAAVLMHALSSRGRHAGVSGGVKRRVTGRGERPSGGAVAVC
jgi:hypothetical protein